MYCLSAILVRTIYPCIFSKMASNFKNLFNLMSSTIGILLGTSACFVFGLVYGNIHASVWGLLSGIFAAFSFHLHFLHLQQKIEVWHSLETLQGIKSLGVAVCTIGLAAMSWYIFVTLYRHIPMLPVSSSTFVSSVMAFMTAKWGFILCLSAHHYSIHLRSTDTPLLA